MIAGHGAAIWLIFAATIALLLGIDLMLAGRRTRPSSMAEAARWTAVVIGVAAGFGTLLWLREGAASGVPFATGYIVELALSIDNLLVFMLVLEYFAVPDALHPTVLKWGIVGAIVMRGLMISAGAVLLREVSWVIYLLGALLMFTGIRMMVHRGRIAVDPAHNALLRAVRRVLPVADRFRGGAFVVREDGRWLATPLVVVILFIEWTDLVFATDSIPAIFAITRDPFLVYTSNIFAIVGLRALYFLVAGVLERMSQLRTGVALVLVLIGLKMLASPWLLVAPAVSLAMVIAILGVSAAIGRKP